MLNVVKVKEKTEAKLYKVEVPVYNGHNYNDWSSDVLKVLESQDLDHHVLLEEKESKEKTEGKDPPTVDANWKKNDRMVRVSVELTLARHIQNALKIKPHP